MHFEGDADVEKSMANVHALMKMWDMNGKVYSESRRMHDKAKEMGDDMWALKKGYDAMLVELEDGVALVCAMLGVHAVKHW